MGSVLTGSSFTPAGTLPGRFNPFSDGLLYLYFAHYMYMSDMLEEVWGTFRAWLSQNAPFCVEDLNEGVSDETLESIRGQTDTPIPEELLTLLTINNGQKSPAPIGIFWGLPLLPLEEVIFHWKMFRDLSKDPVLTRPEGRSFPENTVRLEYMSAARFPFAHDGAGNYLAVDTDPDTYGNIGQVIAFGASSVNKYLISNSLTGFILQMLKNYEQGNVIVGDGEKIRAIFADGTYFATLPDFI